jgi:hypothetical protein
MIYSYNIERYLVHVAKASNWPTQKIQNNSTNKLKDQTKVKQKKNHMCTSVGYVLTNFTKIYDHLSWQYNQCPSFFENYLHKTKML